MHDSQSNNRHQFDPGYLADYADRLRSNDQGMEAIAFDNLAKNWNDDKKALQAAQDDATQMQRRLDDIARIGNAPLPERTPA